ncbi:MAG: zf-HC2 domain-containing protein [Solobacterium sp.]|nr:zf-HC2 domain-containing protein [Solobacterium sp.]
MKNECSVVQDLLPLYAEKLTSEDTNEFIEEHLAGCEECSHVLKGLQADVPQIQEEELPLKQLSAVYKKNRLETVLCAVFIVMSIAISVFSWITAPQYLALKDAVAYIDAKEGADTVTVGLKENIRHFTCEEYTDPDGIASADIVCWTSVLDQMWPEYHESYITVKADTVWYCESFTDAANDILIWGSSDSARTSLRRLTLNYYLLLSLALSAVTAVIWFIFRKKDAGTVLFRIMLAPLSWLIANLVVERGLGSATFSVMRDFTLICLLAVSLYISLFLLHRKYLEKKAVVN